MFSFSYLVYFSHLYKQTNKQIRQIQSCKKTKNKKNPDLYTDTAL